MVGFVVRDGVGDIIVSINHAIVTEPDLSSSDQLKSRNEAAQAFAVVRVTMQMI